MSGRVVGGRDASYRSSNHFVFEVETVPTDAALCSFQLWSLHKQYWCVYSNDNYIPSPSKCSCTLVPASHR